MQSTKISLIIPVGAETTKFAPCYSSILNLDPAPLEIIVVIDGGSELYDSLPDRDRVRWLKNSHPRGAAYARNRGAEVARGECLLFVDSDTLVSRNLIETIEAEMIRRPEISALFGSYDDKPTEKNFLSQLKNLTHHFVHQNASEDALTFWSGCGVIRRKAFWSIGGFNEQYRGASVEDIELGYRLTEAGHRIRLDKSVQVTHLKRWTGKQLIRTEIFQRALPWTELLLERRGRVTNDLNLSYVDRISVIAMLGLALSAPLSAFWDFAKLSTIAMLALFSAMQLPFFLWMANQRGIVFAARAVLWQMVHYACGTIGFGLAIFYRMASRALPRQSRNVKIAS